MTIVEISALLQSGVLSGLAILLIWRAPAIWAAWLDYEDKTRAFQASQAEMERASRTSLAEKGMAGLAELSAAVQELRVASRDFCRYKAPRPQKLETAFNALRDAPRSGETKPS